MPARTSSTHAAASVWYTEAVNPRELHQFAVRQVLLWQQTPYQAIAILDTEEYGKMLVLDDKTQSAEEDEYIYHEALVHPALVTHPAPRSVLIIGGGEGATLREVLRHPTIDRVVMVDIDQELVEQCVKLLPEWHSGAFQDPRVQLVFADGQDWVASTNEQFDVAILDACDASEDGPASPLYTEPFYRAVTEHLTPSGFLVVQAMELSALDHENHGHVRQNLAPLFRHVDSYATFIPSFWSSWGFVVAGNGMPASQLSAQHVDAVLRARCVDTSLRYYDGLAHTHMFALPKDVRAALAPPGAGPT